MTESCSACPTSTSLPTSCADGPKRETRKTILNLFPFKLHEMLNSNKQGKKHDAIVSWRPHGRAFRVNNKEAFAAVVMPRFFNNQTKYKSFQRSLQLWGFTRIDHGEDAGAYFHKYFLRGKPHLCNHMRRQQPRTTKAEDTSIQSLAAASPHHVHHDHNGDAVANNKFPGCSPTVARASQTLSSQDQRLIGDLGNSSQYHLAAHHPLLMSSTFQTARSTMAIQTGFPGQIYVGGVQKQIAMNSQFLPTLSKMQEIHNTSNRVGASSLPPSTENALIFPSTFRDRSIGTAFIPTPSSSTGASSSGFSDPGSTTKFARGTLVRKMRYETSISLVVRNEKLKWESHGKVFIQSLPKSPTASKKNNVSHNQGMPFPFKLFELLDDAERNGYNHIVSWASNGSALKVHDPQAFAASIMPRFFRQTKYKSFQRQLNLWGFERVTKKGPDKGSYFHPNFLRSDKAKCKLMTHTGVKGTAIRRPPQKAQVTTTSASEELNCEKPDDFIANIEDSEIRENIRVLHVLIQRVAPELKPHTKVREGLLGYGTFKYHYKTAGRQAEWCKIGISYGKQITLHCSGRINGKLVLTDVATRFPKAKVNLTSMRFQKVSDLDEKALEEVIRKTANAEQEETASPDTSQATCKSHA